MRKGVVLVTAAAAIDMGLSFLMPVVLSRVVPVVDFAQYRFFWLAVVTLATFVPLGIEQALVYYLIRSPTDRKPVVVGNTLGYFHFAAILAALLVAPWNVYVGGLLEERNQLLLSLFCLLYLTSLPLDYLPLANQHPEKHASYLVVGATIRVASVIVPAVMTHGVHAAFLGLLLFAVARLCLLLYYVATEYRRALMPMNLPLLGQQLAYGAPFGVASALYSFRVQAEQWLVSALYSLREFGVFSIALLVIPVLQVIQQPIARVMQPLIHDSIAAGRWREAHALSKRINVTVGFILYPTVTFLFVFADEVFGVVLPREYAGAADIMRVYLLAQYRLGVEGTTLMQALGEGRFTALLAVILLPLIVVVSWWGAGRWGLPGAALGSVAGVVVEIVLVQLRLAGRLGLPFGQVQEWGSHARLVAMSVAAAGLSLLVARNIAPAGAHLGGLVAGGTTIAVAYLVLAWPFGMWSTAREVVRDLATMFGASARRTSGEA